MADSARIETTPLSLLERARADSPEAWRCLLEFYRRPVLGWCARMGVRGADADDVSQDVFAAAAAGLTRFRHDRPGDTFRGWLRGITRICLRQFFHKGRNRTPAEGGSSAWVRMQAVADPLLADADEDEAEIGQLYRQALAEVRGEFEAATWQAFWQTAVEARSPAAVAAELGMTPAAIRQAKSRVLRRLKLTFGELLE